MIIDRPREFLLSRVRFCFAELHFRKMISNSIHSISTDGYRRCHWQCLALSIRASRRRQRLWQVLAGLREFLRLVSVVQIITAAGCCLLVGYETLKRNRNNPHQAGADQLLSVCSSKHQWNRFRSRKSGRRTIIGPIESQVNFCRQNLFQDVWKTCSVAKKKLKSRLEI